MMIKFDSEICTNFEEATSREWLETNGIGGFASSTISGANSRRYHGLLIAATKPPLGRVVMLSKFEETLYLDGKSYELSANRYPNSVHPQGFKYLKSFRLDPFPIWTFEIEGIELEKKIFMVYGENTTVCQWSVINDEFKGWLEIPNVNDRRPADDRRISLELKPLLAFRDYHHLRQNTDDFRTDFEAAQNIVSVTPSSEFPALFFTHNAASVEKTSYWYRDFEYAIEKERGFDFRETLFQPFALKFDLSAGAASVIASERIDEVYKIGQLEAAEL